MKWSLQYTVDTLEEMRENASRLYEEAIRHLGVTAEEVETFRKVSMNMYLPEDKERGIFLQQDGFLDKEIVPVSALKPSDLP